MMLFEKIAKQGLYHEHKCGYWDVVSRAGSIADVPPGADDRCTCGTSRIERLAKRAVADGSAVVLRVESLLNYEEAVQALRDFGPLEEGDARERISQRAALREKVDEAAKMAGLTG